MSAVDSPALQGSRMPAALWESPFPAALNGADGLTPVWVETSPIFGYGKVILGFVSWRFWVGDTIASDVSRAALAMVLYGQRTDHVSYVTSGGTGGGGGGGSSESLPLTEYTGQFYWNAHNFPTQTGYSNNQPPGDDAVDSKVNFLNIVPLNTYFNAWPIGFVWTLTDAVLSGVVTSPGGDHDDAVLTLSSVIDVAGILESVCVSFEDAQFWWGDTGGVYVYNDVDVSALLTEPVVANLGSLSASQYDGALQLSSGVGSMPILAALHAFTGWNCDVGPSAGSQLGGEQFNTNCGRVSLRVERAMCHHNYPTSQACWRGQLVHKGSWYRSDVSWQNWEIHVLATGIQVARDQVCGLCQDIDIAMPAHPTAPLADDGTAVINGVYNFVVIGQAPADWAAAHGATLIYG